jgi:hypothetical protein
MYLLACVPPHQAELEAAALSGRTTVKVDLPDVEHRTLEVALGEERVQDPATDKWYEVKWAQDDAGRLVVLEVVHLEGRGGGQGLTRR